MQGHYQQARAQTYQQSTHHRRQQLQQPQRVKGFNNHRVTTHTTPYHAPPSMVQKVIDQQQQYDNAIGCNIIKPTS